MELMRDGDSYDCSMVMSQGLVDGFQLLSGDNNALHIDESYAQSKGYLGKVVYGNLLGVMISYFAGEVLKDKEVMLLSQSVEYRRPVYIDDEIFMNGKVTFINEAFGVVEIRLTFKNQSDILVAKGKVSVKHI